MEQAARYHLWSKKDGFKHSTPERDRLFSMDVPPQMPVRVTVDPLVFLVGNGHLPHGGGYSGLFPAVATSSPLPCTYSLCPIGSCPCDPCAGDHTKHRVVRSGKLEVYPNLRWHFYIANKDWQPSAKSHENLSRVGGALCRSSCDGHAWHMGIWPWTCRCGARHNRNATPSHPHSLSERPHHYRAAAPPGTWLLQRAP